MNPDPSTDPEFWSRVEALFDSAIELPAGDRRAFLDEACSGDAELRARVEALLAADAKASGFLATSMPQVAAALLADTSSVASTERLTGRELGPYRLIRPIGAGGMGVVYEAEDSRLRRRVAIKLLPPDLCRDPAAKERFLREARAASALDDPNICTVHDIGESEGRLYIVMAFYEGETLKERLQRGPLPVAEARQVAIKVARALSRSHGAGIVHRDIKPANVMIDHRGEVKVLDFGIAKIQGDATLTRTGDSPGTPAYMSPEQARRELVDGRTDLWALGALLYEMLAGRRPFPGNDQEVLLAILSREPEPIDRVRPETPRELARIVAKALAKSPEARYQAAPELLADLEAAPAGELPANRLRARTLRVGVLFVGVLALGLLLAVLFALPPVRKVAILRPEVTSGGNDPEIALVASDVMNAALAGLLSLERLEPLDLPEAGEKGGSEAERLRAAEADEVLRSRLDCQGRWCRVTLRRVDKEGEVLKMVGPFEVQAGIENAFQLEEGVKTYLRQLYPKHRPRPESSGEVRPQDYAALIEIERRSDRGEILGADDLTKLESLLQTSPDFLDAYLLAAGIARGQREFDRALGYAARAEEIAPHDPRPLFNRLRIEVEAQRPDAAQATLERLVRLAPSDARVQISEADLLEARGELKKAHGLREEIVRRRPTWRRILDLAMLEIDMGESDSARRRLEGLLVAQPDNQWVKEKLAALETQSGDPKRAAALFEELIALRPQRKFLANLGFNHYLLGNYAGAAEAYRRALALEPDHLSTRFSLAAALEAQGDTTQARRLYRTLVQEIEAAPDLPDVHTRMLHAQCLVRLGQSGAAARLADEVLQKMPQEVQDLHQAAQLYALLGESHSALHYAQRARKGLGPAWFTIPEFHSLEKDPDFQALLVPQKTRKAEG
jgi:tetratricopeptide (TPR) repeat protein